MAKDQTPIVRKIFFNQSYRNNVFNQQSSLFLSLISLLLLLIFYTVPGEHYKSTHSMTPFVADNFSRPVPTSKPMQTKLIFLLIDGMSYRFLDDSDTIKDKQTGDSTEKVDFDSIMNNDSEKIRGHLPVFKKFKEKHPEKTIFEPMNHSPPTWTIHGI